MPFQEDTSLNSVDGPQEERVHVYLARIGVGSRREIEGWISAGKVQINAKPARLGQKINPRKDRIRVRGKELPLAIRREAVAVVIYKPRGVVTTLKDPEGRVTVSSLVPKRLGRLFPVGRLDIMTEGLLLMTNDGELAQRLTHPKYEIPKIYEAKVRGRLDEKKVEYLRKGVRSGEEKFQPVEVLDLRDATRSGESKFIVTLKIREGKNHHVRRLFEAVMCRVIKLKRLSMGSLTLKGIPRGGHRILSKAQVERLRREVGLGD